MYMADTKEASYKRTQQLIGPPVLVIVCIISNKKSLQCSKTQPIL